MDKTGKFLEQIYKKYNRPSFISPDPLETVLPYKMPEAREIAGLIASVLAMGNVQAMLPAIRGIFLKLPDLLKILRNDNTDEYHALFSDFRYRFFSGSHIALFLTAIHRVLDTYETIECCFLQCLETCGTGFLGGLDKFCRILRDFGEGGTGILIPDPGKGSACKRMMLFFRWMVRRDDVDKGFWDVDPALLLVPVDTHMLSISRRLGFTDRKQADMKTALEITEAFRGYSPKDPVKYDFALTRMGIHPDLRGAAMPLI
jgi:uncharacterized protein (TIGR02757 family)